MKHLYCRDAGFDCEHEIVAETVDEVLQQAAEHVQSVHNLKVTPELAEQVRDLIHDKESIMPNRHTIDNHVGFFFQEGYK